jgi:hypothetical protein
MKAALIVMTIMGCDDSATQCHYIDTVDRSWQTVSLCDAQAEGYINRHQNANYPVIVAVCESSGDRVSADVAEPRADASAEAGTPVPMPEESAEVKQGLAARALNFVRQAIPDAEALKQVVTKPVRYAEDGYSWVAKRFTN